MIRSLRAASSSAGMNACSRPRPCTTSASARFNFVTKLGFTGTLWGSCVPSAIVSTETRSPPIWRAMSATSGNAATTRSLALAGDATSAARRNAAESRRELSLCEAMAVTPDEGGPLKGVTLVGTLVAPRRVELESQPLELRRHPGHERRSGPRQIARVPEAEEVLGRLGIVEAGARRVPPREER